MSEINWIEIIGCLSNTCKVVEKNDFLRTQFWNFQEWTSCAEFRWPLEIGFEWSVKKYSTFSLRIWRCSDLCLMCHETKISDDMWRFSGKFGNDLLQNLHLEFCYRDPDSEITQMCYRQSLESLFQSQGQPFIVTVCNTSSLKGSHGTWPMPFDPYLRRVQWELWKSAQVWCAACLREGTWSASCGMKVSGLSSHSLQWVKNVWYFKIC